MESQSSLMAARRGCLVPPYNVRRYVLSSREMFLFGYCVQQADRVAEAKAAS
jgi:hypothetical protein